MFNNKKVIILSSFLVVIVVICMLMIKNMKDNIDELKHDNKILVAKNEELKNCENEVKFFLLQYYYIDALSKMNENMAYIKVIGEDLESYLPPTFDEMIPMYPNSVLETYYHDGMSLADTASFDFD